MLICINCRHIRWETMPVNAELKEYYSRQYIKEYKACINNESKNQFILQENNREYYRSHLQNLVERVGKVQKKVKLLDYGSSIPVLVHEAKNYEIDAVAVEYDEAAHEYAAKFGLEILTPDSLESVADRSIDILRFSHVLEHLVNPCETLRELLKKLRIGGVLYVTQPNHPILIASPKDIVVRDAGYPVHLQFFSALSLKLMLQRNSIEIENFWTHPGGLEEYERNVANLDLELIKKSCRDLQHAGDPLRGKFENYPYYCGENAEVFGRLSKRVRSNGYRRSFSRF